MSTYCEPGTEDEAGSLWEPHQGGEGEADEPTGHLSSVAVGTGISGGRGLTQEPLGRSDIQTLSAEGGVWAGRIPGTGGVRQGWPSGGSGSRSQGGPVSSFSTQTPRVPLGANADRGEQREMVLDSVPITIQCQRQSKYPPSNQINKRDRRRGEEGTKPPKREGGEIQPEPQQRQSGAGTFSRGWWEPRGPGAGSGLSGGALLQDPWGHDGVGGKTPGGAGEVSGEGWWWLGSGGGTERR